MTLNDNIVDWVWGDEKEQWEKLSQLDNVDLSGYMEEDMTPRELMDAIGKDYDVFDRVQEDTFRRWLGSRYAVSWRPEYHLIEHHGVIDFKELQKKMRSGEIPVIWENK